MVRDLKKPVKGLEALEKLEADAAKEVDEIEKRRQMAFERDNELTSGFFFSVVFDTHAECQKWLDDRGLKLEPYSNFIKARDFKV